MSRLHVAMLAITAAVIALTAPTTATAAPKRCVGVHLTPTVRNATTVRRATLCLLNRQRSRYHLPQLRAQGRLTRAAMSYAQLMVRQGFFDHVSPTGSTMTERIRSTQYLSGVRNWSVGENLAWGAGSAGSPARIVVAWMHSPGHRRNILDSRFREIGIGLAIGAPAGAGALVSGGTYATEFGRRRS